MPDNTSKARPEHIPLRDARSDVTLLKDVNVPKSFYNRILTGVQVLDEIFGGPEMPGLLPGASCLWTGAPGAGKSTLLLQIADLLHRNAGRNVHLNVGEEGREMVRLRAKRCGVVGEFSIGEQDNLEDVLRYVEENGVEVLVQDSMQSLSYKGLRGHGKLLTIAKRLHKFAHENLVTIIVIGHCNKAGKFAGPMEVKHDLDMHAHIKLNPDSGVRVLEFEKNRWGPAGIPYEIMMSPTGFEFQSAKQAEVTEETPAASGGRASERRENVKEFIKEKLLEGERISGYCFERFEQDVSGGFWRGMIEKARRELTAAGYEIGEERKGPGGDGRTHVFIIPKEDIVLKAADEAEETGS